MATMEEEPILDLLEEPSIEAPHLEVLAGPQIPEQRTESTPVRRRNQTETETLAATIDTPPLSHKVIGSVPTKSLLEHADIKIIADDTIRLKNGDIVLKNDKLFIFNALLANRGMPKRAVELRLLGFGERDSVMQARSQFVHSMRTLIRVVNNMAGAELIEKRGTKKGTRYQIPEDVTIADQRVSLIGENASYTEREKLINDLCKTYKDDPYVVRRLLEYRNLDHTKTKYAGTDELGAYLREVGAYRLLNKDDEIELFGEIETGLEHVSQLSSMEELSEADQKAILDLVAAREIIYHTNLRLAVSMSKRLWRVAGTMSEIDVIQEANIGLSQAIPRMDISKDYKFSTYATHWIRQAMGRAIANQSREIRIPVHMHEKYVKAVKIVRELNSKLGHEPSDEEIEAAVGMPLAAYNDLMRNGQTQLLSLNKVIDDEHGTELGEFLAKEDFKYEEADETFGDFGTIKEIVDKTKLGDRERLLVALRFGLPSLITRKMKVRSYRGGGMVNITGARRRIEDRSQLTQDEVGVVLGVSRERVRQLEQEIMASLRYTAKKLEISL